jgi:hypothetical protein
VEKNKSSISFGPALLGRASPVHHLLKETILFPLALPFTGEPVQSVICQKKFSLSIGPAFDRRASPVQRMIEL